MKPVPGICDRCGQRYDLRDLKMLYILGRRTGIMVCEECYEESHPQLDTRGVKTNDKQSVKDPRSDSKELIESRRLSSFNPVGCEATSTMTLSMGRVTVVIT